MPKSMRAVGSSSLLTCALLSGLGMVPSCSSKEDVITYDPGTGGAGGMGGQPDPGEFSCRVLQDGTWGGALFSTATAGSEIGPREFDECPPCVSGELAPGGSEWGALGWNIAQELDPETNEPGQVNSIVPGWSGVRVAVDNPAATPLLVMLAEAEDGGRRFCAPLDETGIIEWGDFSTDCGELDVAGLGGAGGGGGAPPTEIYDPETPIAQILLVVPAQSATQPTAFDFCALSIASY